MKWTSAFLCLVLLLGLASCSTVYLDGRQLESPVKMNSADTRDYTVVKEFRIKDKAGWLFFVPVNQPAGDQQQYFETLLRKELQETGGDAIIDLTVKTQNDILDYVTRIALGVYWTRTVIIEGKVIKYSS